jgi:hypothetical protein
MDAPIGMVEVMVDVGTTVMVAPDDRAEKGS